MISHFQNPPPTLSRVDGLIQDPNCAQDSGRCNHRETQGFVSLVRFGMSILVGRGWRVSDSAFASGSAFYSVLDPAPVGPDTRTRSGGRANSIFSTMCPIVSKRENPTEFK